jgi:hypothetical protein
MRVRYARGEIGRDEFVQRTRDLGGVPPAGGVAETAQDPPEPDLDTPPPGAA